ncbi:MAG: glyoxalase superfamily protein [Gaiellales bacterium]
MPISHASVLLVPVSDQDRALVFYRDVLGFEVFADNQVGPAMRWIHMRLPQGGLDLALADWLDTPAGSIKGLFLDVDDVEAVTAELEGRGLAFSRPIDDTPFGRFHPFEDPDGNELVLHQPPPGLLG